MNAIQILVIDLGSQYSLVIGRTLRELSVRSIILSPKRADDWLKHNEPKGIILSGGSAGVYEEDAPSPPGKIFQHERPVEERSPILGICYGMHWLTQKLGGEVTQWRENKEYGETKATFDVEDPLFKGLKKESIVWASHGDSVVKVPRALHQIASSDNGVITAISSVVHNMWGVQFHPEVPETQQGKKILENFLKICDCEKDWSPQNIIADIRKEISMLAKDKRAIIGFSGGVDSSTVSAILSPVFWQNLLAICIDTGALRKDEVEEIKQNAKAANVQLNVIKKSAYFQKILGNATHSEIKRKRFKKGYARILEEEAKKFGANFIIQGSLATDIIESGQVGGSALIKSHHNIGLNLKVKELHPFRNLFKYEVRALAEELGLPDSISKRQPFPGPGLFVRVIGKPPKPDKLSIVRWADAKTTEILRKENVYDLASQWIVGLECNRTVGIKGDGRTYAFTAVVRGLITADFMTGKGAQIPTHVRKKITSTLTKHPKIVRVHYDETNKPPATTELE